MRNRIMVLGCLVIVIAVTVASPSRAETGDHLAGAVFNASHRPVASVWVIVRQESKERGRSLTGDDGRYYIANLQPGRYEVEVRRGDVPLLRSEVQVPTRGNFDLFLR